MYDVIARIPGSKYPDQWVIRGNHHDGWVNGAGDPISGASPEMEEARGLAELLKQGWKPDRTIIYCFWDGEEPGLLGSTEWAETHADELKQHAVAYINSDGNGRGFFRAEGSHSLENFVNGVMKDINDPETKMTVWKRARLADISRATGERRSEVKSRPDLRIAALGSGSDYTVFIDHLGVAEPEHRIRRRGSGRRPVSLDLRRFLLVHAFRRHGFCVWAGVGANRRDDDHAPGVGGCSAVPVHGFCGHDPHLRHGGEEASDRSAGGDQGAELGDR